MRRSRRNGLRPARWLIAILGIGVVGTRDARDARAMQSAGARPTQSSGPAAPTITVVTVKSTTATRTVGLPGELRPYEDVRIYPKVTGFVRDIAVDRGSRVRKGDVLAHLEAPELTAQLSESVARAQAADASLAEGQARLEASRATYERMRRASATDGVISPDELQRAHANALADTARLVSLRSQANAAHAAQRAVAGMENYLIVTAPFGGIVTERNAHPGALVGPGGGNASAAMFRLQDESRLRLTVAIPETYAGSIVASSIAAFQVRAFPSDTFHAPLSRNAGALDPQTRSEMVEFDVLNEGRRLKAGMYADVLVPIKRPGSTMIVPITAVATSVDGPFVIVVKNDTTHWVRVRKGDAMSDGTVEVFGNLHDGEQIAVNGTEEIRSGVRVHAVQQKAASKKD